MENQFKFKIADFLFKHFYLLYKPLYFLFKKRQDAHELELVKKLIKPGDTVIDIGANIGFYCRYLSECVGVKGKVYAFEPDKLNFERLKANTKNLNNVEVFNKAVASKSEILKLYTSPLLNVDHRTFPIEDASASYEVEAVSIDEFVSYSFSVNFIKMDIQGFEYFALQGIQQTLLNNPSIKILMELSPVAMKKAGVSTEMLFKWIDEKKLLMFFIEGNELSMVNDNFKNRVNNFSNELQFENIVLTNQPL